MRKTQNARSDERSATTTPTSASNHNNRFHTKSTAVSGGDECTCRNLLTVSEPGPKTSRASPSNTITPDWNGWRVTIRNPRLLISSKLRPFASRCGPLHPHQDGHAVARSSHPPG